MDEELFEIERLIDDMKILLKRFGRNKRMRSGIKEFDLKTELIAVRRRWFTSLDLIFHLLGAQTFYDKIAGDLVKGLNTAKIQYKPDENTYKAMIECVTIPIIATIMDEQELSKESLERQERRKCFINHLIDFKLSEEETSEVINILDDSDDASPTTRVEDSYRAESIIVVGLLIDALNRHSRVVTSRKSDFATEIYHIINVTYIVDVICKYLEDLNRHALMRCAESSQHAWCFEAKPKLIEELERFEAIIVANYDSFDVEHPHIIFRHDLSIIKNKIRFAISTLKRRVDE